MQLAKKRKKKEKTCVVIGNESVPSDQSESGIRNNEA